MLLMMDRWQGNAKVSQKSVQCLSGCQVKSEGWIVLDVPYRCHLNMFIYLFFFLFIVMSFLLPISFLNRK